MIRNNKQYVATGTIVRGFEASLREMENDPAVGGAVHPMLRQAYVDGLRSQIDELKAEVAEYRALLAAQESQAESDAANVVISTVVNEYEFLLQFPLPKALLSARKRFWGNSLVGSPMTTVTVVS